MAATADKNKSIFAPVYQINWANTEVNRVSIVPILEDGQYRFIGLGINAHNGNVTTIGGSFEKTDFDLLSTSVREWNEEMEIELTEDIVESVYALQYGGYINILLPVADRNFHPRPNHEIFDLIWLSPNQLYRMKELPDVTIGSQKIFTFNKELTVVASELATVIHEDDGYIFHPDPDHPPFIREKRIPVDIILQYISDPKIFLQRIVPSWFAMAYIPSTDYIVLCHPDQVIYKLPIASRPAIIAALIRNRSKILVADPKDVKGSFLERLDRRNLIFITSKLRNAQLYADIPVFRTAIKIARSILDEDDRIETEAKLVFRYEYKGFKEADRLKTLFNGVQACTLLILDTINYILATSPHALTKTELLQKFIPLSPKLHSCITKMNLNLNRLIQLFIDKQLLYEEPNGGLYIL